MRDNPKVSVVMTVRDAGPYLRHALESVRVQEFQDWELLLWDDGSTDGSLDIEREFVASEPRADLFSTGPKGRVTALIGAFATARGEYVGVVDADDLLSPHALRACVAHLDTHPDEAMVYTDHEIIDENGASLGVGWRCKGKYSPETLLRRFQTFQFRLMRLKIYDLLGGFDERYTRAMDYDFCLRLSEEYPIGHIARPLYGYRENPTGISSRHRVEQDRFARRAIREARFRRAHGGGNN